MREVFQPADNIIAPNLQDFPWAPSCQLAIQPTSEKSKLPHHGFTCPNWLAPNSTLVTFIRIFLSKLEELARQGGTSATLNSIQGSVGIGIFIGWHWYLHWLALVGIGIFSPSVKRLGRQGSAKRPAADANEGERAEKVKVFLSQGRIAQMHSF